MNFSKKNHQIVDQNDEKVKKPQKHDVNVQKNGTLYFQVGLALMLLVTYTLFEMRFQVSEVVIENPVPLDDDDVFVMKDIIIEKDPVKQKRKPQKKKVLLVDDPKIVDDITDLNDALNDIITDPIGTDSPDLGEPKLDIIEEPDDVPVSFIGIEKAPVYPGCEKYGTERERKQCMSSKINKLITRKLNPDKLASAGVLGRQTVFVEFTIDKQGMVSDIKTMTRAKSHADDLKQEALRVTKKIPQMKPGKQSNKVVPVRFTLPITVDIKD